MEERILGYGVIGTGVYCDHYFGTLGPVFRNLRPVGCSDLNTEAAKAAGMRSLSLVAVGKDPGPTLLDMNLPFLIAREEEQPAAAPDLRPGDFGQ